MGTARVCVSCVCVCLSLELRRGGFVRGACIMPIICIGPVCVPISAVWPVLILLIKPLWSWLETRYPYVNDYAWVQWFQKKFGSSPPELSKEIQDGVQAMSEKELSS